MAGCPRRRYLILFFEEWEGFMTTERLFYDKWCHVFENMCLSEKAFANDCFPGMQVRKTCVIFASPPLCACHETIMRMPLFLLTGWV
ncbi:hypothetical protein AD935_05140 [Gluconobacter japonicus]|nr:hypothetical protein AD935_05140 [Gluconobacter japonicus]